MRTFHVLIRDTYRTNLENVCDYDIGDFDSGVFSDCRLFEDRFPSSLRLWVQKGETSDYIANPLNWPIVSDRLAQVIASYERHVQFVDVPLYYENSTKRLSGYKMMNVLRCLKALDLHNCVTSQMNIAGKSITNVMKFVLRENVIPDEVHVFRPEESRFAILVSDELAHGMTGMTGVAFVRTRTTQA
jgi:hypothetical protein